ncbi:NB-ARC domain-containing protein [Streptomyces sp. NBC_01171]|uniref:NB-ARC domain-containing protein n=1 Tax=Streptomyces sp. NBC_01171 TaxID=2903757 RepID=UPI0038688AAD|nr:NB-ARC domain-containing protein [Streptomyces sp. NBC_01171]
MPHALRPGKTRTMDEFIAELRLLKAWAGSPSITEITRRVHAAWQRAGRPRSEWPARSTVGNCFQLGRRRPNSDLLLAVVHALVGADAATFAAWRLALHAVLGEAEASSRVTVADHLPRLPPHHVERNALLQEAASLLGRRHPTLVLHGMAGTGKTVLALALGHRLLAAAPQQGPVLYADLHGRDAEAPATDPAAVLDTFLRVLGLPGDRIPRGQQARVDLFRQLLGQRRALIILDDAADEEQIRPLLPHEPTSQVLITSRHKPQGIADIHALQVPALTPQEAAELLHQGAGPERLSPHSDDVRRIVQVLAGHPFALTAIAHHLRDHPTWTPSDYLSEPLTMLAMEGGVRAALARSTSQLNASAQHLLRLLTLHPGHDIDIATTAALLATTKAKAATNLTDLAAEHLVEETTPGRFHMSTLVRLYAEERLGLDEPASAIRRAVRRLQQHMVNQDLRLAEADSAHPGGLANLNDTIRIPAFLRPGQPAEATSVLAA